MTLNKQSEVAAMQVYEAYWDSYLKGDLKTMAAFLDDDIKVIGSTEAEVFFNKKEALDFYEPTADQIAGKAELRNRVIKAEPVDGLILITEQADFYILIEGTWTFYSKARLSSLLHNKEDGWKLIQQHGSLPDTRAQEGEQVAVEKISKENLELRDAIKRRTIELEQKNNELLLESSLERVRAIAMGMRNPADLLDICEIMFSELKSMGFDELRNAMINIHDDEHQSFLNYDFSTDAGKTITPHFYNSHPVIEKQVKQVRRSKDAFSETVFTGEDLADWKKFRKEKGEKDDPKVDDIEALYYYFYSIGSGAIGISTYRSVTEEKRSILKRFRNVFDFAYQRYMDVAQATAQAREAQIEAALEKVRSRSLAMNTSEEIKEVVVTVMDKMNELNIEMNGGVSLVTFVPGSDDLVHWYINPGHVDGPVTMRLPYFDNLVFNDFVAARRAGKEILPVIYDAKEKDSYFTYAFQHSDFNIIPEALKQWIFAQPYFGYSVAIQQHAAIFFNDYTGKLFSEKENAVLIRFAKVFEQAYIRFLDLQKAEAQAREAQIEAALERVRSRSMGMQKSEELQEVIKVVYDQLVHLNINLDHAGFVVDYQPKGDWHFWIADEQDIPAKITHPYFESVWANQFNEAKEKSAAIFATHLNFEEKNHFYNELLSYVPGLPEASKDFYLTCPALAASTVLLDNVALYIENFSGTLYTDEENKILMRFGYVFQQTYTRFLDLQKAEAQSREAQIEAALERVRSIAMSMMKSDDLLTICKSVFTQLQILGFKNLRAAQIYIRNDEEEKFMNYDYAVVTGAGKVEVNYNSHPNTRRIYDIIRNAGDGLVYNVIEKEQLDEWKSYLYNTLGQPPEESLDAADGLHYYLYSFGMGAFGISTFKAISSEELAILKRFRNVFNLSYQRYTDIALAEAQAREARIETALEKVRSRTLAMQQSAELGEVATELFKQMNQLVDNLWSCGFVLCEKNRSEDEWWLSTESGFIPAFYLPNTGDRVHENLYTGWKNEENFRAEQVEGAELEQHYEWLMNIPVAKKIFDDMAAAGYSKPDWQKLHAAYFSKGYLVIITQVPCAEEEVFKRFAQVFDLTYTRFLDLQKAEFQTRQAKIETALEKVRARALAMQQPEELTEVAQVMRHEMGLLGVEELETSSIYIHEENTDKAECWYAIKAIRVPEKKLVADHFELNLQDTWVGRQMFAFYQSTKKRVSIPMQGLNRMEWINYCSGQSKLLEGFYGDHIPDRTYHLYKFSSGTIGAATPGNISAESWDLLQRAASVFSLAYSRFKDLTQARIDLQRLKEEKQRAETALTELQLTQKQLIQAEKMASLGELTAGIAHEIQNPLNFVNNFSEVSKELLDEMKEAIDKGDTDDAKEIMNDVIQNLEKINHHGKRADAIVKGMLQHSQSSSGKKEPTNINALADEYLRLAYHGLRAKDKSFNATLKTDFDETIGNINIIPQDIGRVLLNLFNNAFYAAPLPPEGGFLDPNYLHNPTIWVSTKKIGGHILICVKDNGPGIPQKILDKIFQPFFTTKPTGQGTGLGLSLSYDIVKAHGGELKVETINAEPAAQAGKEGEGTTFMIKLPVTYA